jgi:hypothetical protein
MALDPRQTFGNVGATAQRAPTAARLVAEQTIQGATMVGLANAQLGDTIGQSLETIRKAGIVNDKTNLDAYGAALGAREAEIRLEQQKVQQETGEMWTPEQLSKDYNERLSGARAELSPKYQIDFIADEKAAFETKWTQAANESYTRSVIQPRTADIGRRSIEQIAQNHTDRAATLTTAGDITGALAALGDATTSYDSPQAAVLYTPEQRLAYKNRITSNGTLKALTSIDPKRSLELTTNSLALRQAAEKTGSTDALAADPLKNVSTLQLLDWRNDFTAVVKQQENNDRIERQRQQAVVANGYQAETTLFMTDPKVSSGSIMQRMMQDRQKMRDMTASDPGNPMLDVLGSGVRQMQNEIEQRQRKAEAAAAKQEKANAALAQVSNFLTSGQVVDPSSKGSREIGDAAFDMQEKSLASSKLSDAEKNQHRLALITRLNYIPATVERQITQGLTSSDPQLQKVTLGMLKQITDAAPSTILGLPQREQTIGRNVLRNGMSVESAVKEWNADAARSPEEKAVIKQSADKQTKEKDGPYFAPRALGKEFGKGTKTTIAAEAAYQTAWERAYATNGRNAEQADASAKDDVKQRFSVTKSDGNPVLRENQPIKFGLTPEQERDQVSRAVQARDFKGTENYRLTYVNTVGGKPNYGVEVANRAGSFTALPGALTLDPHEPVFVPPKQAKVEEQLQDIEREEKHAAQRKAIADSFKEKYGK